MDLKIIHMNKGYTLVEVLVTVGLFVVMMGAVYGVLTMSQSAWVNTDTSMQMQGNIRAILGKVSEELRQSGADSTGTMQVSISDNTGTGGSDVLKFSIPVLCNSSMTTTMDANANVAYWGAPLTWGCTTSSCMDANNSCTILEYKYIQYLISGTTLVRKVLDVNSATVQEKDIARNITNFQAVLSADQKVVTLTATAQQTSGLRRDMTASSSLDVRLRNKS